MKRHKSHFSIPQAITCVLDISIRHVQQNLPPPTLALITDITHGIEHHDFSAQLQRHMKGLAAWLYEQNMDVKSASSEWWKTIWDELENEEHERLQLSVSCTTDKSHPLVPSMHLAYDGAQVCMSKNRLWRWWCRRAWSSTKLGSLSSLNFFSKCGPWWLPWLGAILYRTFLGISSSLISHFISLWRRHQNSCALTSRSIIAAAIWNASSESRLSWCQWNTIRMAWEYNIGLYDWTPSIELVRAGNT